MTYSLLDKLLEFYKEDPNDPFNQYALALEYQKSDTSKARQYFERLLREFPTYLPTYYHAAQFFNHLEQTAFADQIFQKGIQLALEQQNHKTHQELVRAYRSFLDDLMDE